MSARGGVSWGKFGSGSPFLYKNLKIAVFAGSFNPIHQGHVEVARLAVRCLGVHFLYILVSPASPFKSPKDYLGLEERVAMCKGVVGRNYRIRVIDIEKFSPTCESYFTSKVLYRYFFGAKLCWIMGSDNISHMHTWRHYSDILRRFQIVCFARSAAGRNWIQAGKGRFSFRHRGRVRYVLGNEFHFSSTDIRRKYGKNWPARYWENIEADGV